MDVYNPWRTPTATHFSDSLALFTVWYDWWLISAALLTLNDLWPNETTKQVEHSQSSATGHPRNINVQFYLRTLFLMLYSWKNIYFLNFWSILVTPDDIQRYSDVLIPHKCSIFCWTARLFELVEWSSFCEYNMITVRRQTNFAVFISL